MRIRATFAAWLLALAACGREEPKPAAGAPAAPEAAKFARTTFAAHTRVPIEAGKNVIWCAAFQSAWDSLARDAGGALGAVPGSPTSADVEALNRSTLPASLLASQDAYAFGGLLRNGGAQKLSEAWRAQFPRDPPLALHTGSDSAVAVSWLVRDIDFPFCEDISRPVRFTGGKKLLRAFGFEGGLNPNPNALRGIQGFTRRYAENPLLLGYEVAIGTTGDRMVLTRRMWPPATLEDAWTEAARTLKSDGEAGWPPGYEFVVPRLDFDATAKFPQLLGVTVGGAAVLREASQRARVRFGKAGSVVFAKPEETAYFGHSVEFNDPFLVAFLRGGAERPYFLAWIANDDLLEGSLPAAEAVPADWVGEWRSPSRSGDDPNRQRVSVTAEIDERGQVKVTIAVDGGRTDVGEAEIVGDARGRYLSLLSVNGKAPMTGHASLHAVERTQTGLRVTGFGQLSPWDFTLVR